MEAEELVKRTKAMIEKSLGDYFIFEIDRNPVACIALHLYPEQQQGELACLYVSASHENEGIGRKLIQFVEDRARQLGLRQLLALSTQAFTLLSSPKEASKKALQTICHPRGGKSTNSAAGTPRCW